MGIFTNKNVKRLFILISSILVAFICLLQLLVWLLFASLSIVLILVSLLFSVSVLGSCFLYFKKQNQIVENAISQVNLFLSGDTNARIECDNEGSLYKLFHAVNTLATTLDAHVAKEQQTKEFLKNTISDISHQLKTPLAALSIYNSALQDDNEDKTFVKEFASKSEREIDRIETLVQNLLKITRLDAGIIVMDRRVENVADMMEEIYLRFETRANMEKKTITLFGSADVEIICDRDWILESASNIVKNALDHTVADSRITLEWKRMSLVTQIMVKDNGSGIHPEDIHHIFKRFYRSRFSKDMQGIGLGLSLAKVIVDAHDGNITVDSVLGGGSTFTMSFLNLTKL